MEIRGIDVSKYQGVIDFERVAADGVSFVIIRAGWCGYDGLITTGLDSYFTRNIEEAKNHGIAVGVYLYSYAKTPENAKIAAKSLLQIIEPYEIDYPVVFDFEDSALYKDNSKEYNSEICNAFLSEIEAAGYYAMLYSYTYFLDSYLDLDMLKNYDIWVADYRGYVGFSGNYGIWQYSSTGRVSGISGDVDLNIAYKDYKQIIENASLNGKNAPVSEEVLEEKPIENKYKELLARIHSEVEEALLWE